MTWQVSLLIAVFGAVDWAIRKWAWPQVLYALWLLVLVKLVLPPTLASPTSLVGTISDALTVREALTGGSSLALPPEAYAPTDIVPPLANGVEEVAASHGVSWKVWSMLVWLGGFVLIVLWTVVRLARLRQVLDLHGEDSLPPEWMRDLIASAASRLGLRTVPVVRVSPYVRSPGLFGAFRPVVVMPAGSTEAVSRQEAEHILLHEFAHLKRGDPFAHALSLALSLLYWFNPLLWIVQRRTKHLREVCCDATVAACLRDQTPAYRRTLLGVARHVLDMPAQRGLGFLGVAEDASGMVARLRWLEKSTWRNRRVRFVVIAVLVLGAMGCVLPMARTPADQSAPVRHAPPPVLPEPKVAEKPSQAVRPLLQPPQRPSHEARPRLSEGGRAEGGGQDMTTENSTEDWAADLDSLMREMQERFRREAEAHGVSMDSLRRQMQEKARQMAIDSLRREMHERLQREAEARRPNIDSLRREMHERLQREVSVRRADMDSLMREMRERFREAQEEARREAEKFMQPLRSFREAVRVLLATTPLHPEIAQQLAETGKVVVSLTMDIAADGMVKSAVLLQGPPAFREAILEAAMKTSFPAAWWDAIPNIRIEFSASDLGHE